MKQIFFCLIAAVLLGMPLGCHNSSQPRNAIAPSTAVTPEKPQPGSIARSETAPDTRTASLRGSDRQRYYELIEMAKGDKPELPAALKERIERENHIKFLGTAAPATRQEPAYVLYGWDQWDVSLSETQMGNKVMLMRWAQRLPTDDWTGGPPTLLLRCSEGKMDVVLMTWMLGRHSSVPEAEMVRPPATGSVSILVRLDENAPLPQVWHTGRSAFIYDDGIAMARLMAAGNRLRIQFPTARFGRVIAEFNLSGLDEGVPLLANACGWR